MTIPFQLEEALDTFYERNVKNCSQTVLAKAFERISDRYRKESGSFLQTNEERWAYLYTRLPATFAVSLRVFQELKDRIPELQPKSLLDVGAGPGTGTWAAFEVFDSLQKSSLLEQDQCFLEMGRELFSCSNHFLHKNLLWNQVNIERSFSIEAHDVSVLSYSIGEVKESYWQGILEKIWISTEQALVVIEPGTPSGYQRMMKIRDLILKMGGFLLAPCPHSKKCPLQEGDWCHFFARVQRSSLHRKLKSGDLGYEDEKFTYLIFGKKPSTSFYEGRVIRHPIKRPGVVELTVCKDHEICKEKFSKRNKEKYKDIKKLNWGNVIT